MASNPETSHRLIGDQERRGCSLGTDGCSLGTGCMTITLRSKGDDFKGQAPKVSRRGEFKGREFKGQAHGIGEFKGQAHGMAPVLRDDPGTGSKDWFH